jgi:hypothetical protein
MRGIYSHLPENPEVMTTQGAHTKTGDTVDRDTVAAAYENGSVFYSLNERRR